MEHVDVPIMVGSLHGGCIIKVLHVTFDMRIGGTEQVIKNIIQGSDKTKLEMSILCIESPLGPFAQELLDDGIVFHQ